MNKNRTDLKFDFWFFTVAIVILLIIGFRLGVLTPLNLIICLLLVASSPFLLKQVIKHGKEEKITKTKLEIIDSMTDEELFKRISELYTGRGFALERYDSKGKGIHVVCERTGVRNGTSFTERGAVLVICSDEIIDIDEFKIFKDELSAKNCTQGMMVTNYRFSPEVIDEAKTSLIALWNRENIRENLHLN